MSTDPALFQSYLNNRTLSNPAFVFDPSRGFRPSEDTQKVISKFKDLTGRTLDIRPVNSVMANEGVPIWGTGGGFVDQRNSGVGYVDPLMGTAHVVAHEGAHALMPTAVKLPQFNVDPLKVPRDTGQRLRYVHETLSKPSMWEEANAQGISYGVLNSLGMKPEETWETPVSYPATFVTKGFSAYGNIEKGPASPGEMKEAQAINKSLYPFLNRVFNQAYQSVK